MTNEACLLSILGPVGRDADNQLFNVAQAENLKTVAGRGEEVLKEDYTAVFCGALIRCEAAAVMRADKEA